MGLTRAVALETVGQNITCNAVCPGTTRTPVHEAAIQGLMAAGGMPLVEAERTLLDEPLKKASADLLPHEFVHSWNGKFRRPAGLATADYQQPMKGELLWVYEGLTEYLGSILAARSGLRSAEDQREHLAIIAAYLDKFPGRTWRPLIDTTVAA